MKDYFKFKVTYLIGDLQVEFEEFFTPPAGMVSFEKARELCFARVFEVLSAH